MVDGAYADGEAKVEILHRDLQIIRSFASDAQSPAPQLAVTAAMALGMRSMEEASVSVLLERLAGLGDQGD